MVDIKEDPSELSSFAMQLALQAGRILKGGFGSHFLVESKTDRHDLVTEYDRKVESFLIGEIKKKYPSHSFLAEESGASNTDQSGLKWIIDPLDGTVNFAHHIPMFSVSIAITHQDTVLVGCIYNPMVDEMFHAIYQHGSYLNNKKIQVSSTKKLKDAMIATGFPYNVAENPFHCIDQFAHIAKLGIPIRRIGSAAIDLAYVAAGKFDAFWEVILQPWDFAAGLLIIKESGGMVSDLKGRPVSIYQKSSIVATNSHLHTQAIEHLSYYEAR
ncbi:MAG: inositol monophosphatase [Chlamydiales bacterium]|nr:inositol monophosphatase [Chlamydiales bacterium]